MTEEKARARRSGMELHEIKPWQVGGDPTDPNNKVWVTRDEHMDLVRFWNGVIRDERERQRAINQSAANGTKK